MKLEDIKYDFPNMPENMRQDFRTIDCSLCDNAMASAMQ